MEREYFDAKFDGLKELMVSQQANLNAHIGAVSSNVKRLESDLTEHRESVDAHGRKATDRFSSNIVAWAGLIVSAVVGAIEMKKH